MKEKNEEHLGEEVEAENRKEQEALLMAEVEEAEKKEEKQKKEVPSQIINKTGKHFEIVFQADVPSFAIHIYAIVPSEEKCQIKTDLKISGHTLENSKYRVIFNKNGDLAFLLDKELNTHCNKNYKRG